MGQGLIAFRGRLGGSSRVRPSVDPDGGQPVNGQRIRPRSPVSPVVPAEVDDGAGNGVVDGIDGGGHHGFIVAGRV